MGTRREGREAAIQFLYQLDLNRETPAALSPVFWSLRSSQGGDPTPAKIRTFTEAIVTGVMAHAQEIDDKIKACVANYDLHRIAPVDRNVLRLAIYEMLFCPDIPPVVSINEAIEIAKKFGGDESGRFVNGILDRIRGELSRPARQAAPPAS